MHPQQIYSWRTSGAFSESAVFIQTKAGVLEAVNILTIECITIHQKNMCPHEPVNTICRCSSFHFTLAWLFRTLLPIQTLPMQTKYPSVGLAELCQVTTATQVLVNSHWEVGIQLNVAVGDFPQLKLASVWGKGCEKTEEPHSIAQASWAISNSEWKEIMNQIIGNGNRATKMTS